MEYSNIIFESYMDDFDENDIEDVYYDDSDEDYIEEHIKNEELLNDKDKLDSFVNGMKLSIIVTEDKNLNDLAYDLFDSLYEKCEHLFSPLYGVPFVVEPIQHKENNVVEVHIRYNKLNNVPFVKFHYIIDKLCKSIVSVAQKYNTDRKYYLILASYFYPKGVVVVIDDKTSNMYMFNEFELGMMYSVCMSNTMTEYKSYEKYDFYGNNREIYMSALRGNNSYSGIRYKLYDYEKIKKLIINNMTKRIPDDCSFNVDKISENCHMIYILIDFNYNIDECTILDFLNKFMPVVPFYLLRKYYHCGKTVRIIIKTDTNILPYTPSNIYYVRDELNMERRIQGSTYDHSFLVDSGWLSFILKSDKIKYIETN